MTVGRHGRRADIARYRREALSLLTYLVAPDDTAHKSPLLKAAADHWLDALGTRDFSGHQRS